MSPMFEYTCLACDHDYEQLVPSASEATNVVCPRCGNRPIKRISAASFKLKGPGFYATDYGRKDIPND